MSQSWTRKFTEALAAQSAQTTTFLTTLPRITIDSGERDTAKEAITQILFAHWHVQSALDIDDLPRTERADIAHDVQQETAALERLAKIVEALVAGNADAVAAADPFTGEERLDTLSEHPDPLVREFVVDSVSVSDSTLRRLAGDNDDGVRAAAAERIEQRASANADPAPEELRLLNVVSDVLALIASGMDDETITRTSPSITSSGINGALWLAAEVFRDPAMESLVRARAVENDKTQRRLREVADGLGATLESLLDPNAQ